MECRESILVEKSTIDFPIFLLFFNTKFPIFPIFSILSFLFSYFFEQPCHWTPWFCLIDSLKTEHYDMTAFAGTYQCKALASSQPLSYPTCCLYQVTSEQNSSVFTTLPPSGISFAHKQSMLFRFLTFILDLNYFLQTEIKNFDKTRSKFTLEIKGKIFPFKTKLIP